MILPAHRVERLADHLGRKTGALQTRTVAVDNIAGRRRRHLLTFSQSAVGAEPVNAVGIVEMISLAVPPSPSKNKPR
jgi:hypothetical protein